MTWRTHAVGGVASIWLLTPFLVFAPDVPPAETVGVLAACAGFGALLPDLDAAQSRIKYLTLRSSSGRAMLQPFLLPSEVLYAALGHRGLLHSLLGWLLFTLLVFMPLGLVIGSPPAIFALSLGYGSHLVLDGCTKHGVPLWFPQRRCVHLLPRPLRLTTASAAEEPVFALLALLSLALLLRHFFHP